MTLRQFLHTDPVIVASRIVGCGGKGAGVVVDPVDVPEHYVRAAAQLGMAIRYDDVRFSLGRCQLRKRRTPAVRRVLVRQAGINNGTRSDAVE